MFFEDDGEIKQFGLKKEQTIYSVGVFSIVLAIICFYIFCVIDMVFE